MVKALGYVYAVAGRHDRSDATGWALLKHLPQLIDLTSDDEARRDGAQAFFMSAQARKLNDRLGLTDPVDVMAFWSAFETAR